jgi:hypothetical protein
MPFSEKGKGFKDKEFWGGNKKGDWEHIKSETGDKRSEMNPPLDEMLRSVCFRAKLLSLTCNFF